MDDFEKKMHKAAAAPSADPQFVNRLRGQLLAAHPAAHHPPVKKPFLSHILRGNTIMRTRYLFPAFLAVVVIALTAFFALKPAATVSAQQILERASAAQAAPNPSEGIWHVRYEQYRNPQALPSANAVTGASAGTTTVTEFYVDLANGLLREIITGADGEIQQVFADDGKYFYDLAAADGGALTINRTPLDQEDEDAKRNAVAVDTDSAATSIFENFRDNPRVTFEGTITRDDGRRAYVLADENYQSQQQGATTYTGAMKMIFDAETYELLESQTFVHRDGQDILIDAGRFLTDEILPASTPVVWDLSDLPGVVFVDQPADTAAEPQFKTISQSELAALTANAYVLDPLPEGFTQEIILVDDPREDELRYEINYSGPDNEAWMMMAVGAMDAGFIETNFYDGSYKTATGLVINYSPSAHDSQTGPTNAMLTLPDGNCYLLHSTFSREQVQALAETLIPAR